MNLHIIFPWREKLGQTQPKGTGRSPIKLALKGFILDAIKLQTFLKLN